MSSGVSPWLVWHLHGGRTPKRIVCFAPIRMPTTSPAIHPLATLMEFSLLPRITFLGVVIILCGLSMNGIRIPLFVQFCFSMRFVDDLVVGDLGSPLKGVRFVLDREVSGGGDGCIWCKS